MSVRLFAVALGVVGVVLLLTFAVVLPRFLVAPPLVFSLSLESSAASSAMISVDNASVVLAPSAYRVNLTVGGSAGVSQPMPTTTQAAHIAVGNGTFFIYWLDSDASGTLDRGDKFSVQQMAGDQLPAHTQVTFWLLLSQNRTLASVQWTIPVPRPLIQFGNPVTIQGAYTSEVISIQSASNALGPSYFRVNLLYNTTLGGAEPMPTTSGPSGAVSVLVGASTYRVAWTDLGGEATVNAGDIFTVTYFDPSGNQANLPSGQHTLYLLWPDGTTISQAWFFI